MAAKTKGNHPTSIAMSGRHLEAVEVEESSSTEQERCEAAWACAAEGLERALRCLEREDQDWELRAQTHRTARRLAGQPHLSAL